MLSDLLNEIKSLTATLEEKIKLAEGQLTQQVDLTPTAPVSSNVTDEIKIPRVKKPRRTRAEEVVTNHTLTPKEIATRKKEPWVSVVGFNVNPGNIRNGFYELDWNSLFIDQLRLSGYGYDGDPEDEIVSRWFRDVCLNAALSEGVELEPNNVGSLDVSKLHK